MFTTTSTGGSICLRCQARLGTARLTPKRSGSLAQRAVTSPQARPNTTLAAAEPSVQRPHRPGTKNAHPLGRLRGIRGVYVREGSASLDALSLGLPSKVIILRDAKIDWTRSPRPPNVEDEVEPTSAADMLSSIDAEKEHLGADEIIKNIEKHRPPKAQKILNKAAFEALAKELCRGFTNEQLKRYLDQLELAKKKVAVESRSDTERSEGPLVLERSTWTPGTTPFVQYKVDRSLHNDSNDLTRKQNLAFRVLRNGWSLEIKEEVEAIGELELRLRPHSLSILLNPSRALLEKLAEYHKVKMDISKSRGIVRITADQATATAVYRQIKAILKNVTRTDLDLTPLEALLKESVGGFRELKGSVSDTISELTGTDLEFSEDGHKLSISYIGPKTRDVDDARRLFLAAIETPKTKHKPITWDAGTGDDIGALPPTASMFGTSWKDRQKAGSRWTFPLPSTPGGGAGSKQTEVTGVPSIKPSPRVRDSIRNDLFGVLQEHNSDVKSAPLSGLQNNLEVLAAPSSDSSLTDPIPSRWTEDARQVCSVQLGQILHKTQDETAIQRWSSQDLLSLGDRTMSACIPGALSMLRSLRLRNVSESLQLRLLPSPWTVLGADAMEALPEIEMLVDLRDRNPDVRCVAAIIDRKSSDVMLPEQRADLRFKRDVVFDLLHAQEDPAIAEFIAGSNLNYVGAGRLRAPPNLKLKLPRRIIQDSRIDLSKLATQSNAVGEEIEMEYLFSGLDHRHSMILDFEDYLLEYTTIEAGKIGGRRQELHLLNASHINDSNSANFDELISCAYRLVDSLRKFTHNSLDVRSIVGGNALTKRKLDGQHGVRGRGEDLSV